MGICVMAIFVIGTIVSIIEHSVNYPLTKAYLQAKK